MSHALTLIKRKNCKRFYYQSLLSLMRIHSVSSLASVEIKMKESLPVAINLDCLLYLRSYHTKTLQTLHKSQHTLMFYKSKMQRSLLLGTRGICYHYDYNFVALQPIRTFVSSTVVLTSNSSSSQRNESDAIAAASTDNTPMETPAAADAEVGSGLLEIANSMNESPTSASLLFPDFPVIHAVELTMQKLHEITGLPWWATITLTSVTLRMVFVVPLQVYALHNAEKLSKLQPEILEISKRLKQEVSMAMHQFKWDEKRAKDEYIKNMKRLLVDLHKRHNCHPMKSTASFWLQLPLWISVSYSLRNMTSRALSPDLSYHEECKTLTDQGTLWFPDMTITDSTWVLPVLMGFVTLFNIEMTHLKIQEETKYRKRLTLFLRFLALLFIPISSTMPSAMVFYWVNSGCMAAVQNILLDWSHLRRLVGLGPSETESSSPIKVLVNKAKQKYLNR